MLLVSSTFREAEELTAALQSLVGEEAVAYYPAWETLPHERLSPRSDTVGRRLDLLRRLAGNSDLPAPQIVVAPVRSVLQPQVKGLGDLKPIRLAVGEEIDLTGPGGGAGRLRRIRASTWSSGGASSPYAAASSTSFRRPRSTPYASTSSATLSRRFATSPSPTSDPATSR